MNGGQDTGSSIGRATRSVMQTYCVNAAAYCIVVPENAPFHYVHSKIDHRNTVLD